MIKVLLLLGLMHFKVIFAATPCYLTVLNETQLMMRYLGSTEAKILKSQKSSSDFKEYVKNKFIKLHNEYSTIFNKTCDGQMNLDMLNFLCEQQECLRKGRDQYSTDVNVGQAIFDKYAK